jgi:hypothetical protein
MGSRSLGPPTLPIEGVPRGLLERGDPRRTNLRGVSQRWAPEGSHIGVPSVDLKGDFPRVLNGVPNQLVTIVFPQLNPNRGTSIFASKLVS